MDTVNVAVEILDVCLAQHFRYGSECLDAVLVCEHLGAGKLSVAHGHEIGFAKCAERQRVRLPDFPQPVGVR